jgi:hypothetical protein
MINEFKNFKYIEESYLDSNFAPLYHKTTTYDFYKIINENILRTTNKIIPYDFFIHTGKEKFPKSNTLRKEPFENEEIILSNINNILNFIISVDFKNDSILDRQVAMTIPILRKNNIKIYNNGKIF